MQKKGSVVLLVLPDNGIITPVLRARDGRLSGSLRSPTRLDVAKQAISYTFPQRGRDIYLQPPAHLAAGWGLPGQRGVLLRINSSASPTKNFLQLPTKEIEGGSSLV